MSEPVAEASSNQAPQEHHAIDTQALYSDVFSAEVKRARIPRVLRVGKEEKLFIDVARIPGALRLPRSLVRLLENVVRRAASDEAAVEAARRVVEVGLKGEAGKEVEFSPARVLFQDFTGVPIFVDFAAMRDAMVERGGNPKEVNPRVPCVLVVDHSVIADCVGTPDAAKKNLVIEAKRNAERFAFLKWASESFDNVTIVPPGQGICHQLNVERFSSVVTTDALYEGAGELICFDTLVGSDSHTTTANGLGVMGWGLGGIECEAAALGLSLPMRVPEVVNLKLVGHLKDKIQAMDVALTICELLRGVGVVGKIVEVNGPGVGELSVTQRTCIANMTPEYGATATIFPIDDEVLSYLRLSGKQEDDVAFVESYARAQGVFGEEARDIHRIYAQEITFDLSLVEPSLAGPSRPQDRVGIQGLKDRVLMSAAAHGHGDATERFSVVCEDGVHELGHGALGIAAITSCTTATDAAMVVAAGLLAKRAVAAGLKGAPWVKRILAPGSKTTTRLLDKAGLTEPLAQLGFATCGWGCMSCIGNSGALLDALLPWVSKLEITSVLSGNRNFEGRISPDVAQNYLTSPAQVVAYAIAGTMAIDLSSEPVGIDSAGRAVMLADLMPTTQEVNEVLSAYLVPELFGDQRQALSGDASWDMIEASTSETFAWDPQSTYIKKPPYFDMAQETTSVGVEEGRLLAVFGDFVTTDHISPAGAIPTNSPAARYLSDHGVAPSEFNTYGARRGNHEVMERGTFGNVRLQNHLAQGKRGGYTTDFVSGAIEPLWDFAKTARSAHIPLVVVAGKMYGSGSSRDWAAKGPLLQGVRCVIAESFERIHRSNLVGMGIIPLELMEAEVDSLGLEGSEVVEVEPIEVSHGSPAPQTRVKFLRQDGTETEVACRVRIDTPTEARYMAKGGILPYVLNDMIMRSKL